MPLLAKEGSRKRQYFAGNGTGADSVSMWRPFLCGIRACGGRYANSATRKRKTLYPYPQGGGQGYASETATLPPLMTMRMQLRPGS